MVDKNNTSSHQMDHLGNAEKLSFIMHQDNLMWSRLQTIAVIQIGALSAAYGLRKTEWLSLAILGFGLVLTPLTFFLLKRDELCRMKIEEQLPQLDWGVDRTWFAPLKGREATWIITGALIVADFFMCVIIVLGWV